MNSTRRDFLVKTGLTAAGLLVASVLRGAPAAPQRFNMCGYAAPRLERIRVGIVGIGSRGSNAVDRLRHVEGLEIKALCDLRPERVAVGQKRLDGTPHQP